MEDIRKTIGIIKSQNFSWVNVAKTGKKQMEFLKKKFDFLDLDLNDCLPPLQRPKLMIRENYLFMILNFPIYDKKTKMIKSAEIDFFIGKNFLITVHNDYFEHFKNFEDKHLSGLKSKKELFKNQGNLLYQVLESLIEPVFPMLNNISLDIEHVEKRVLDPDEPKSIHDILIIKRNIANFRKIMLGHKAVIRKLIASAPPFFPTAKINNFFNNLVEQTKDVWDTLENYKETIDALHQTKESIHGYRLNDIMKTLTLFSILLLPLTLLASIFGMNTVSSMPFIKNNFGFWLVISLMFIEMVVMFIFFKKKRWL